MTLVSYGKHLDVVMHYLWLSQKYEVTDTTHTGLEKRKALDAIASGQAAKNE